MSYSMMSRKAGYDVELALPRSLSCNISTRRSLALKGGGWNSTAFTMLKDAVFNPIPRDRIVITDRLKTGLRTSL